MTRSSVMFQKNGMVNEGSCHESRLCVWADRGSNNLLCGRRLIDSKPYVIDLWSYGSLTENAMDLSQFLSVSMICL
jgi:hypothetical protein